MSPSTHIILNDEMDDFSTPNTTNNHGITASKENFIAPRKRPLSSMSPIIITDNESNVRLITGASGGPRIISAVAYVRKMKLNPFYLIVFSTKKSTNRTRSE